ncbi:hypothetical protein HaLaN_19610 [Haematococcus lacustris]|uniref:Uncharacterized protein n=1 Tax=Haematococcus lacustris TaxID=44745 RepID=A0A699ZU21_HAELA|nr:hypothetical protein HaLaN_19610 [Haematococcus lacustris]
MHIKRIQAYTGKSIPVHYTTDQQIKESTGSSIFSLQLRQGTFVRSQGVKVKKEGSATSISIYTLDTAELLKLVELKFGAGGRLKTNDGDIVGTNFLLEHGATLIWHPPVGGEYDHFFNVAGPGGGTHDVNHHASACTHAPLA